MKIEVLQAFVAAAEQCSFLKAAEQLYLSAPTVSRYIAEMEKTVGDALESVARFASDIACGVLAFTVMVFMLIKAFELWAKDKK